MTSNNLFTLMITAGAVFAICATLRQLLLKKIVESTGGTWDWRSPLQNKAEAQTALQNLPANSLRSQFWIANHLAILGWIVCVVALILHSHRK